MDFLTLFTITDILSMFKKMSLYMSFFIYGTFFFLFFVKNILDIINLILKFNGTIFNRNSNDYYL